MAGPLLAAVPHIINYQGRMVISGVNFDGQGKFKFALLNPSTGQVHWRNSPDSSPADGVPDAELALPVSQGVYSVGLGDTSLPNMAALPPAVFANEQVYLRVWFNDGSHGWQQLAPDRQITAVGYAMLAESVPDGSISTAKIAPGAITADRLAPGAASDQCIDVTSFGADKTGAADSSAQVQAAINAAAASSTARTVFFPTGTYKCNVTLPAQVNLLGAGSRWWVIPSGESKTILKPADNTKPVITIAVEGGQKISRLEVRGNGHATSATGIKVSNEVDFPGSDLIIESVYINKFAKGLWNQAGINIVAINLFVLDCMECIHSEDQISGQAASTLTIIGGQYGGMYVQPPGAICFNLEGAFGTTIIGAEMGNCYKVLTTVSIGSAATTIIGGNVESISGPCIMDVTGGWINWTGSNVMSSNNPSVALVRIQGYEGGATVTGLRTNGLTNYGGLGAPLVIETWNAPLKFLTIQGFPGVIRRCAFQNYNVTVDAFIPTRMQHEKVMNLATDTLYRNSSTMADVEGMSFQVAPGRTYEIEFFLAFEHTTNSGSKAELYTTANMQGDAIFSSQGANGTAWITQTTASNVTGPATFIPYSNSTGNGGGIQAKFITTTQSAGTLKIRAAQATSHADATTLLRNSYFKVREINN